MNVTKNQIDDLNATIKIQLDKDDSLYISKLRQKWFAYENIKNVYDRKLRDFFEKTGKVLSLFTKKRQNAGCLPLKRLKNMAANDIIPIIF